MILSDTVDLSNGFIQQVHFAYKGNNRAPAVGTDKYNRYVAIANRLKDEWAKDPKTRWKSLWEMRDIGTIATGVQAYDLDDDVIALSDKVYVIKSGQTYEFAVTHPNQRAFYQDAVFVTGSLPKVINFYDDIIASTAFNAGTLRVPVYFLPDNMSAATDDVPVDDPNWLVYATAAELARNDPAKQDQFPDLLNHANDLYSNMTLANNQSPYGQPNAARVDMPSIGGF